MNRVLLLAAATAAAAALIACNPNVNQLPGEVPSRLTCEVVNDSIIAEGYTVDARLALSGNGDLHAAWLQDGAVAMIRPAGQEWQGRSGALSGAPGHDLSMTGYDGGVALLLRADSPAISSLWRFVDGAWRREWEGKGDNARNQAQDVLASADDGTLHFSLNVEVDDDFELKLLGLSPQESTLRAVTPLDDGRDPLVLVDAAGARHAIFKSLNHQELHYLGPDGRRSQLPHDGSGWPSAGVADDGIYVVKSTTGTSGTSVPQNVHLLSTSDGMAWRSELAYRGARRDCEGYHAFDHEPKGEHCEHVHRRAGVRLISGVHALALAVEHHEEGLKIWACSNEGEHMCYWQRGEDYRDSSRLLIGTVSPAGVVLSPIELELDGASVPDAIQDDQGHVHLLLRGQGDPSMLRHVELSCSADSEVAP